MDQPTPVNLAPDCSTLMGKCGEIYADSLVAVACCQPDYNEINFIKTKVHYPNGGEYEVAFTHVSGPKIDLNEARQKAADYYDDHPEKFPLEPLTRDEVIQILRDSGVPEEVLEASIRNAQEKTP